MIAKTDHNVDCNVIDNTKENLANKNVNNENLETGQFPSCLSLFTLKDVSNCLTNMLNFKILDFDILNSNTLNFNLDVKADKKSGSDKRYTVDDYVVEKLNKILYENEDDLIEELSEDEKNTIKTMYNKTQETYEIHYRENDMMAKMNTSFVLHKILMLLKKPLYAKHFVYSKQVEEHWDSIWLTICNHNNWI